MVSRGGGPEGISPTKNFWIKKIPNENKSGKAPKNNASHGNLRWPNNAFPQSAWLSVSN